jgi:DNA-binding cell septation regulator SpoVG
MLVNFDKIPRSASSIAAVFVTRWAPVRNPSGATRAYFSVELPSGLVVNDLRLMAGKKGGGHWIGMPARPMLDRDGNPKRDENGKAIWNDTIEFRDRETRDRFAELILEALRAAHPEALEELPL